MKVSAIYCYPIKGCSGISLKEAELTGEGLKYDRNWMIVDESGRFISQRSHPHLCLFKIAIQGDRIAVQFKGQSIDIPVESNSLNYASVSVWDDTISAQVVSEEINQWFSDQLNQPLRLVKLTAKTNRLIDPKYAKNNETVSFADGYPYLAIGESSLDDLNERLEEKIPMNRFRPNIVFSGGKPFEEDAWEKVNVGASTFIGVKRCARCQVTTTDQETGLVGKEPLKTLSKYRREGNKVFFGQNLMLETGNWIKVGDSINVISRKVVLQ